MAENRMTITLGEGDLAFEIKDGASVPLRKYGAPSQERAIVRLVEGRPVLFWNDIASSFMPADGTPHGGWPIRIDIKALVEERRAETAPPATTCREGMPAPSDCRLELEAVGSRIKSPLAQTWTHRPGNTPEKQAAFDEALDAWLTANLHNDNVTTPLILRHAAAALGYGIKR